ncbi:HupE / UreJ protein [Oligella ureolytica]|uniref:HupE / UreJ protein n=1 Tax=Oligella ureolytica TaxID=90244 RepID=A0A378XEN5_9BURK|nr:HupE/UreJ family protein [Oligella ureolytica]QPT40551.1 HupE/UreJ family protein [Oligella ureolytica]SUA51481.1 HupE / UreJ protein [Oligella ureolytica]
MTNNSKKIRSLAIITSTLFLLTTNAYAHPGHIGDHDMWHMLMHGLEHPLTGIDHLLAMLAVGIWSALTHKTAREAIALPFAFVALLLVGAVLGLVGVHLPAVEPMIVASLLVLGLLVAGQVTMKSVFSYALVGLFALFHGLAHGMELPQSNGAVAFIIGFVVTTLALHLSGLFIGFKIKAHSKWISRLLGVGIAGYGALLLAGV